MNKKGFSIMEILVVIFIMTTLMVLGFVNYRDFEKRMSLSSSANQIISALHLTNERTISSSSNLVHGVHFTSDSYTLFASSTYDVLDPNNEVYTLPAGIEISGINVGGSDVVFDRLTGTTTNSGTIVLRIISNPAETRTVEVLPSGRAGFSGTITTTDSRIKDGRHTHFSFAWSLQGKTNLILTFHNPPSADTVNTVVMATYFNPGQTAFDWEGTTVVNGTNQTVRVHTHSLDGFNTVLCIHRDGRVTNKALDIKVDTKNIVSYTAAGVPTVGAFGGTMAIQ